MASDNPQSKKRKLDELPKESTAIVIHPTVTSDGTAPQAKSSPANDAQLVSREQLRYTLDVSPTFITSLSSRGEIGYWRSSNRKVLTQRVINLNCEEIRRTMTATLNSALYVCYYELGSMRQTDIDNEVLAIVPATVDVCMTALYAKLRSIHKSFGPHKTRYTQAPSYSKDIELPLPISLAIQELGVFESSSLVENVVLIPTFPEGTEHEGRAQAAYPIATYQSYVPTYRELKIPMKSIDPHLKAGSPWWTYKVETVHNTTDFICTLPPSLYTDFSAQLRMLFLYPNGPHEYGANEIVQHPPNLPCYGIRAKELKRGMNVRAFLALSHTPSEWWSFS